MRRTYQKQGDGRWARTGNDRTFSTFDEATLRELEARAHPRAPFGSLFGFWDFGSRFGFWNSVKNVFGITIKRVSLSVIGMLITSVARV